MFKNLRENISEFEQSHGFFFVAFLFLAILLFKNPFSQHSFIPNLYPYPDTIHYINPVRNLIAGEGFKIAREGRKGFAPNVPPLYSFILLPFFIIYNDPRVFYFANVLLAHVSFCFFYLVLLRIIKNRWIRASLLLLYVTNLLIHWYPMLAMAENLILPLFLLGVFLLVEKINLKTTFLAGFIAISFYATKYANAPLSVSFFILYMGKIFFSQSEGRKKIKLFAFFLLAFFIFFVPFETYEYSAKSGGAFSALRDYAFSISQGSSRIFSSAYFKENLGHYFKVIQGRSVPILFGQQFPVITEFIAMYAWIGLIFGLFKKRVRCFVFSLMVMLFTSIFFISTFFTFDVRYIYNLIPTLLFGFGIFLDMSFLIMRRFSLDKYFYLGLVGLLLIYLNQAQINLTFKENDPPSDYIAVLRLNEYFNKEFNNQTNKPIIISVLPPYFIDFYSNKNYKLLPLSASQHFFSRADIVWGENDYSDLITLYNSYLSENRELYVEGSVLMNYKRFHSDYLRIIKQFKLEKVSWGCGGDCNIYRVYMKNKKNRE